MKLARGPAQLTTAKNMNMQMIDRLRAMWAIINDETRAISSEALLPRHFARYPYEMAQ